MITAFLLGLAGSLHCAGMCGPLVLLTPVAGNTRPVVFLSRIVYHAGRLLTYASLGVVFGAFGASLALAGFQRWLSIFVGLSMILGLFLVIPLRKGGTSAPNFIKALFARFARQRTFRSVFTLGAINGLLPCGLVYMAATASIATGSVLKASAYMVLFGLGTLPMLLAIGVAGQHLRIPRLQKLAPIAVATVALLLILRAQPLSLLGAPAEAPKCPACAE